MKINTLKCATLILFYLHYPLLPSSIINLLQLLFLSPSNFPSCLPLLAHRFLLWLLGPPLSHIFLLSNSLITAISVALCWAKWLSLHLLSAKVSQNKKKEGEKPTLSLPYLRDTNFHTFILMHIPPISPPEQLLHVLLAGCVCVCMCEQRSLASMHLSV